MGLHSERKRNVGHVSVPKSYQPDALLRVAAVQIPRLSAEDRAALRPFIERDMAHG